MFETWESTHDMRQFKIINLRRPERRMYALAGVWPSEWPPALSPGHADAIEGQVGGGSASAASVVVAAGVAALLAGSTTVVGGACGRCSPRRGSSPKGSPKVVVAGRATFVRRPGSILMCAEQGQTRERDRSMMVGLPNLASASVG
jgi:hypothetical protein